ncbi:MAG: hypothetical protein QOD39_1083 [Mycobacterium sp.]|jgi:hypothetical protein|nr:hypothetical protein [Mycobacterium sp.]
MRRTLSLGADPPAWHYRPCGLAAVRPPAATGRNLAEFLDVHVDHRTRLFVLVAIQPAREPVGGVAQPAYGAVPVGDIDRTVPTQVAH